MAATETFTVLVSELPANPENVVQALIETGRYHRTDARFRLRHLPGLLPETFSEEQARELTRELEQSGCRSRMIATTDLPNLRHAPVYHHVRCEDDGFAIVDLDGETQELLPWPSLDYLSVGAVPYASVSEAQTESPLATPRENRKGLSGGAGDEYLAHEAWIVTSSPDRCFRLEEHQMNYEYLGERKSTSGPVNFRLLIEDIHSHASQIALSSSAHAYLERRPVKEYSFQSAQIFREVTRGQIALVKDIRHHE